MERDPWPSTYDHDLDLPPRPSPRARRGKPLAQSPRESLELYQRLVANPVLAVISGVVVVALLRAALVTKSLALFLIGSALLSFTLLLLQFHCLDCGATGWLIRSRWHACPAVVARWRSRLLPQFRGPGLSVQLQMWFYLLMAASILILALFR